MELFRIILYALIFVIILYCAIKNINRTGSYDGFTSASSSYANCSMINDCTTCADTLTANDGVCYWCTDKCVAGGSSSYNSNTCHSDHQKCSTPTPSPVPSPVPFVPDVSKLILLDTPTWMSAQ